MDGQAVLQVARLLRLGPDAHGPELNRIMLGLTPAQRPQTMRAAKAINLLPSILASDPAPGTIRDSFADAGWSVTNEGAWPTQDSGGYGRGKLKIDVPGEEPRWRTIKVPFTDGMTWEEFWAKVQDIIDKWNKKYPDAQISFDIDDFIWF
jgi:hypothetical protein